MFILPTNPPALRPPTATLAEVSSLLWIWEEFSIKPTKPPAFILFAVTATEFIEIPLITVDPCMLPIKPPAVSRPLLTLINAPGPVDFILLPAVISDLSMILPAKPPEISRPLLTVRTAFTILSLLFFITAPAWILPTNPPDILRLADTLTLLVTFTSQSLISEVLRIEPTKPPAISREQLTLIFVTLQSVISTPIPSTLPTKPPTFERAPGASSMVLSSPPGCSVSSETDPVETLL